MMRDIDETARKIGTELHVDAIKAKYMVKAYGIPQVRTHFMRKYSGELGGNDPLLTFCRACRKDEEVRKNAYHWMDIVEDVEPGRLMFSMQ